MIGSMAFMLRDRPAKTAHTKKKNNSTNQQGTKMTQIKNQAQKNLPLRDIARHLEWRDPSAITQIEILLGACFSLSHNRPN